jgi:tetratricopeptide (TPR) repeat protein
MKTILGADQLAGISAYIGSDSPSKKRKGENFADLAYRLFKLKSDEALLAGDVIYVVSRNGKLYCSKECPKDLDIVGVTVTAGMGCVKPYLIANRYGLADSEGVVAVYFGHAFVHVSGEIKANDFLSPSGNGDGFAVVSKSAKDWRFGKALCDSKDGVVEALVFVGNQDLLRDFGTDVEMLKVEMRDSKTELKVVKKDLGFIGVATSQILIVQQELFSNVEVLTERVDNQGLKISDNAQKIEKCFRSVAKLEELMGANKKYQEMYEKALTELVWSCFEARDYEKALKCCKDALKNVNSRGASGVSLRALILFLKFCIYSRKEDFSQAGFQLSNVIALCELIPGETRRIHARSMSLFANKCWLLDDDAVLTLDYLVKSWNLIEREDLLGIKGLMSITLDIVQPYSENKAKHDSKTILASIEILEYNDVESLICFVKGLFFAADGKDDDAVVVFQRALALLENENDLNGLVEEFPLVSMITLLLFPLLARKKEWKLMLECCEKQIFYLLGLDYFSIPNITEEEVRILLSIWRTIALRHNGREAPEYEIFVVGKMYFVEHFGKENLWGQDLSEEDVVGILLHRTSVWSKNYSTKLIASIDALGLEYLLTFKKNR